MIKLNAYRFSAKELVKMGWLKDLFQDNGFVIDRFPEVYYDTFKNASKVYTNLEQHINEDTPDYLGVYIFAYGDETCEEQCRSTKEGVIVLFSDRIQDFCLRKQSKLSESLIDIENALREVVLYHELGHWLSHWCHPAPRGPGSPALPSGRAAAPERTVQSGHPGGGGGNR
jgi:hypothetical protein